MHLFPNREVKHFIKKSVGTVRKFRFLKGGQFSDQRDDQRIFWENEKLVITALTRELQKKLL